MKKLVFSNILIASIAEQKAKKVEFNSKRTIILGKNETGKSVLTKSIYQALGAKPGKLNATWKKVAPILCIRFSVDNVNYTMIKDKSVYGLFDSKDKLLKIFQSVTNEMSPYFSELFDFKIKLQNQANKLIFPPPAFLFLPFYVDQDVSWQNSWKSFDNLAQIKKYRVPITEYHTGLKTNEYYEIQGELHKSNQTFNELDGERKLTSNILNNVKQKLTDYNFNISLSEFQDEIQELLIECEKLKTFEEELKHFLTDLYNIKNVLESQIKIAKLSLKEINSDFSFSITDLTDQIICPTCGAEYENSFVERFEIAKDEQRLTELISELRIELDEVNEKIQNYKQKLELNAVSIEKIEIILNTKKTEIKLQDLITNQGKKEVKNIIVVTMEDLDVKISKILLKKKRLEERLKNLENKERKKNITDEYVYYMKRYLMELDVTLDEQEYSSVTKNIPNTGSALTRTLIAYYFSILKIIKKYSSSTYCPIIIDSPNQQAQDLGHIDSILNFIKNNQPEDSQMILALEELYGINFDCKVIELKDRYNLLQKNEYEEVYEELKVYLHQLWNAELF